MMLKNKKRWTFCPPARLTPPKDNHGALAFVSATFILNRTLVCGAFDYRNIIIKI